MPADGRRHNLVILSVGPLRFDFLSCYGHPFTNTRNIDELARDGVQLGTCYCAAPQSGPSLISFLTSTYVGEHGHRHRDSTVRFEVPNLIHSLRDDGYHLGFFGNGAGLDSSRSGGIWDERSPVPSKQRGDPPEYQHPFSSFELESGGERDEIGTRTNELVEFLRTAGTGVRPFLGWVSYGVSGHVCACPAPYSTLFSPSQVAMPRTYHVGPDAGRPRRCHNWQVHSEMSLATEEDVRRAIAMYCGRVRYIDDQVGRIVSALRESGLLEKTMVVLLAEHGDLLGDYGLFRELPVFYECLTRIPVILRHPTGLWKPGRSDGLVEAVDLAPTLLEALSIPVPPSMVGRSLHMDLLRGEGLGREEIFVEAGGGAPTPIEPLQVRQKEPLEPNTFGPGAMVRWGNWKLSMYADDVNELYNLADDPLEMTNLYSDPACTEIRMAMMDRLVRRMLSVKTRNVGLAWPRKERDPRFEPLEG